MLGPESPRQSSRLLSISIQGCDMAVEPPEGRIPAPYRARHFAQVIFYRMVQDDFETYLALSREGDWKGNWVPAHVEGEFRRYLECGILAHGFER